VEIQAQVRVAVVAVVAVRVILPTTAELEQQVLEVAVVVAHGLQHLTQELAAQAVLEPLY
jgi:hypothetical protein